MKIKFNWKILLSIILISVAFGYFLALSGDEIKKTDLYQEKGRNFASQNSALQTQNSKKLYEVLEVIDGDTFKIKYGEQKKSVRILGMNTPEKSGPYRKRECFGEEATKKAKEILSGKKVSLEFDSSQSKFDKFGRILAYVYVDGKIDFEEEMIKQGYAYEYTYHGHKYKKQKIYKETQKKAEKNKLGLWAENTCNGKK